MDRLFEELKPTTEDRETVNQCLATIEDIIARSTVNPSLAFEFQYWAQEVFGDVTGYGEEADSIDKIPIPEAFLDY